MNNKALPADGEDDYQRAAEWLEQMSAQQLDELSKRRFQLWLEAKPERRALFERMLTTWSDPLLTRSAQQLLKKLPTQRVELFGFTPLRAGMGLAFCLCLCVGLWFNHSVQLPAHLDLVAIPVTTAVGVSRDLHLEDGSQIDISPASQIKVQLSQHKRNVQLQQGAAYFQVAKDKTRPFEVQIDKASVIAVGTEFNIDKTADHIEVTVYEGAVEVRAQAQARPQLLRAGERALISASGIQLVAVNLKQLVDWRSGWLELENSNLALMVDQLNRYSRKPIRLKETGLEHLPVAGRFRLKDVDATLQLLAQLYSLDVREVTNKGVAELHLTNKP